MGTGCGSGVTRAFRRARTEQYEDRLSVLVDGPCPSVGGLGANAGACFVGGPVAHDRGPSGLLHMMQAPSKEVPKTVTGSRQDVKERGFSMTAAWSPRTAAAASSGPIENLFPTCCPPPQRCLAARMRPLWAGQGAEERCGPEFRSARRRPYQATKRPLRPRELAARPFVAD